MRRPFEFSPRLQTGAHFTIARDRARRDTPGMKDNSDHKVSLGCGTLILIAIIVAIFSNGGTKDRLLRIEQKLERIEQKLESLPPPPAEAPVPQ